MKGDGAGMQKKDFEKYKKALMAKQQALLDSVQEADNSGREVDEDPSASSRRRSPGSSGAASVAVRRAASPSRPSASTPSPGPSTASAARKRKRKVP
jgi:hypothetical protein